jgi:serine/threonine-protein kinase
MSAESNQAPVQMLRQSLREDSPLREASVARLMIICFVTAAPFVFALGVAQRSFNLAMAINGFLAVLMAYYVLLLRAMKRGWFHPAVSWVNVFMEASLPATIVLMAAKLRGPEYAVMSPAHIIWGGILVVSALRARPALSLGAGALAVVEWLAIYFVVMRPQVGADPAVALGVPGALLRGLCLFMSAGFGAMFARHFVRKAEEALSTIRQRDLMGKYFLHERIGAGGMAEVYRATYCPEGGFQKPVAIKRVLPLYARSNAFTEMFREEARLCAMLAHPNIVQVFDCGRYNDSFMLAMEYVDGMPLNRLLKRLRRPLPLSAVTYIGAEMAKALDYIHKKVDGKGQPLHLVHRDVNPPNILISRIGEVKLADFGVANAAIRVETGRSDVFYGKLHYAAPEQLMTSPFDGRADLFALGLTLNEALTARKVYGTESDSALNQGIFPRVPLPSELRSDVPPEVDALVMALCEIDRGRRPPHGAELFAKLTALTGPMAPYPNGQQELARAVEEALLAPELRPVAREEPSERATEANFEKPRAGRKDTSRRSGARVLKKTSGSESRPRSEPRRATPATMAPAVPLEAPLPPTDSLPRPEPEELKTEVPSAEHDARTLRAQKR